MAPRTPPVPRTPKKKRSNPVFSPIVSKVSNAEPERKNLRSLYSAARKSTGALGGGGAGGAIYGEVTLESFQRVVDCLVDQCGLGSGSIFIDVGSGLGKPSLHVASVTPVDFSLGVELIGGRWWQSQCFLERVLSDEALKSAAARTFLAHASVNSLDSFDPATHVYSFNRGFPPSAMEAFAQAFHRSKTARYVACFDAPSRMATFGFDVALVDRVTSHMSGSGESHLVYIYERTDGKYGPPNSPRKRKRSIASPGRLCWAIPDTPGQEYAPHVPHAPTYGGGIDAMMAGVEAYRSWIKEQIGLHRSQRMTRRQCGAHRRIIVDADDA